MTVKTKVKQIFTIAPSKKRALYRNAVALAKDIDINHDNHFIMMDGSFIYGDFIEAFFVENNLYTEELTISTLSMSENNVYNLANLVNGGFVGKINLIVSDYFYSHEKWKLIKLLIKKVNNLKIFSVRTHTKICLFKVGDKSYVFSGSSNLRTNNNYEQLSIVNDKDLFDHVYDFHKQMCKGFGEGGSDKIELDDNLFDFNF